MVFGTQALGLIVGPLIALALLGFGASNDTAWRVLMALGAVPAAVGHSSGDAFGVRSLGAVAGSFGRGPQCGIEHPFAPVDFLAHVQDQ
jgi:hypothetical protein